MHYLSTRCSSVQDSFLAILLKGLCPEGGLYVPAFYPQIFEDELSEWRHLSYADLAAKLLAKFAPDIPINDIERIAQRTYTAQTYSHARVGDAADITPVIALESDLFLQCLANGPTLAFKDMAMQLLGHLFEYALDKDHGSLNILGATSGDTGSAAEYAMCGKRGIRVFMLSPHQRMSPFQAAQMYSLDAQNIFNVALTGVFDDCQDIVKAVSSDSAFKAHYHIGTVNSINWARIVAQVIYYFYGYFRATTYDAQKVSFTVPSGNFGNVCAGHVARMMGLPIDRLVVATNENDVLDEFFKTGRYRVRESKHVYHTSSPSMDISKASNFERFIFDLIGRDSARLVHLFNQLAATGSFDLSGKEGSDGDEYKQVREYGFCSGKSTHKDRLATIRRTYDHYQLMVDPHTADGLKVASENRSAGVPMIVLETALPAKFNTVVHEALGRDAPRPKGFDDIENLPQHVSVMPVDVQAVKDYIASVVDSRSSNMTNGSV